MQGALPVASPDGLVVPTVLHRAGAPQSGGGPGEWALAFSSPGLPPGSSPRAHSTIPPAPGRQQRGRPRLCWEPWPARPSGTAGPEGSGGKTGRALTVQGPRFPRAVPFLPKVFLGPPVAPVSWESFGVLRGLRSAGTRGALTRSALLAHRPPCSRSTGPAPSRPSRCCSPESPLSDTLCASFM